jgi:hypothetical protein
MDGDKHGSLQVQGSCMDLQPLLMYLPFPVSSRVLAIEKGSRMRAVRTVTVEGAVLYGQLPKAIL